MTASAAQHENQPRLVDKLLPTIGSWLVAPQGTPLPGTLEGSPMASEAPDELSTQETEQSELTEGLTTADAVLQDAEEIISVVEQADNQPTAELVEHEAPLAQFVQEVAEDQIAPEINEGVEAFVTKSEADGTTPEQEIHELVAQAAQSDTTPEINVVFVPQKRSEHELAKAMSIKQGGSWLRRLVDKLAATLKLRGKVPAFQPEAAPEQA